MTLYSLRKFNPDLDITLYRYDGSTEKQWKDDVEQDFNGYDGIDYMDRVPELNIKIENWDCELEDATLSHKSNILKWQMLGQGDCIYFDMDILFLRDIQPVIKLLTQGNTMLCIDEWLMIGVLGSIGKNVFFNTAYQNCSRVFDKNRYQSLGVENLYTMLYGGFAHNTDGTINWDYIFKQDIKKDIEHLFGVTVANLPKDMFYRYDHKNIDCIYGTEDVDVGGMVGLHWYGGHIASQRFNNNVYEDAFIYRKIKEIL